MWPLIIYEIGQYAVEAFDRKVNRQEVGCSGHIRKVRNHDSIRTDGVLEGMEESNALKCEKYIYIYIYIYIYKYIQHIYIKSIIYIIQYIYIYYTDLTLDLRELGYLVQFFAIGVGTRGLIGRSIFSGRSAYEARKERNT